MAIQWYPGHMHKASKEMAEVLSRVDVVIELIDARIPFSTSNPVIKALSEGTPSLKILTKADLADPQTTQLWRAKLEKDEQTRTFAYDVKADAKTDEIVSLCWQLAPKKTGVTNLVMVAGTPNVGKSTLINALAGRHMARTGDEPAVTKGQQRINLRNGIMLLDTPGILWPKIENVQSSYRLATCGAIKNTAVTYTEIAFFAADYLLRHYPQLLTERFNFSALPSTESALLQLIGSQRGCLQAGGKVDLERVSTIFVNELRAGTLGRISFETPSMIAQELSEVLALKAEKAQQEIARREKRQRRKRR